MTDREDTLLQRPPVELISEEALAGMERDGWTPTQVRALIQSYRALAKKGEAPGTFEEAARGAMSAMYRAENGCLRSTELVHEGARSYPAPRSFERQPVEATDQLRALLAEMDAYGSHGACTQMDNYWRKRLSEALVGRDARKETP
jgi:hypothetical protein